MSAAAAPNNGGSAPSSTRGARLRAAGRRRRCWCAAPGCSIRARGSNGVSDVLVRDGRITEISATLDAPDGAEVVEAEGLHALPGLRRPARAPAHARARGRGGHRLGHARRRGGRLLRDPRSAEHRAGGGLGAGAALAARARTGRGADSHRLHGRDHRRPGRRAAHGDGRAGGRGRGRASPTTGCPCAPPA